MELVNGITDLVVLQTVFEDVLYHQTTSLSKCDFVPHAMKSFVDELHDLGRALSPPQFKQLLPDMTGVTVDDRFWNTTEKFVDHDGLIVLWNGVECLLNHMASERIHRQIQRIATDRFSDLDDLLRGTVLKAALDEEVTETIDHERISLGNNGLDNFILLLWCAHLELLLKEYGCLLIIVTHNLVDYILPIAVDIAVKKTTVVQWLGGR